LEGLIGFFVNTLVLRVDVGGDPGFAELVGRVREVALGAFAHGDVPFEKLVEELAPGRDLSRNPLFQVTFQLFESPSAPDAVQVQPGLELPVTSSLFDLRLDLSPVGEGLAGRVEFDTDLFERRSVEWLVERYRWLLEQVVAEPGRRLSGLSLLPAGQARLVAGWNATGAAVPAGCVHWLVEERARVAPGAVAVADAGGEWSYRELNRVANRLARRLRRLGVGAGSVVAVCVPRGRVFVAAVLAVLKAGGAYLPLDAGYPAARLAQVLADARPRVLVSGGQPGLVAPAGVEVLSVPPWPEEEEEDDLGVPLAGSEAAYLIYTSGSTGAPKGVLVEHRSLLNLVGWHRRAYGIEPEDRGSQLASVGFDAAVWELWPYLCAGASVQVCDDATRGDADLLLAWLAERGVTVAFVPTPLAETLLARPWPRRARLRYLLTGGDRLRRFANPAHPYTLVNHYGPTEATVVTTAGVVAADPGGGPPGIGGPIANTVCYVVDRAGQLCGPGCPGELWIGGAGVARGYHNDLALTAERFRANPFAPDPPRLYRSGDLVRWQPDGTLGFLGRADDQLKIRGYRIEPREIETLLTHHPHINQALVTSKPDATNTPQLLAYITTNSAGATVTGSSVRRWLKGRLPEPMIPAAVVVLDEFPITAHGKIDHDALPPPGPADRELGAPDTPSNRCEEALCRLWADALGVESVGVNDDFFELGGHSLLATQLVSRIRDAFRLELPLRALFEQPTPYEIAAVLRSEAGPPEQVDRAAAVLLKVMALSDEDVDELLGGRDDAGERAAS
jgi:amino acid adenylation domain-containing protein